MVIGEDIVQREDMHMCDLVQKGLASPAYDVGRWAHLQSTYCIYSKCTMTSDKDTAVGYLNAKHAAIDCPCAGQQSGMHTHGSGVLS